MSTQTRSEASGREDRDAREQFRTLPEPVRVEDMIAAHPAAPAPDLIQGDPETDWLLRNAG